MLLYALTQRPNGLLFELVRRRTRISFAAVLVLLLICGCNPRTFRQSSSSMEPTIKQGEVVLADIAAYSRAGPTRWDVIVFTEPTTGQPWCFRVVGLPGESIDIRPQGIFINGTNAPLPAHLRSIVYQPTIPGPMPSAAYPLAIPAGSYFLLGDNTTNANDSRFWGPLSGQNIIGRVSGK